MLAGKLGEGAGRSEGRGARARASGRAGRGGGGGAGARALRRAGCVLQLTAVVVGCTKVLYTRRASNKVASGFLEHMLVQRGSQLEILRNIGTAAAAEDAGGIAVITFSHTTAPIRRRRVKAAIARRLHGDPRLATRVAHVAAFDSCTTRHRIVALATIMWRTVVRGIGLRLTTVLSKCCCA